MATTKTRRRLSAGNTAINSSLSPELEMANTTSPGVTMPRSPWLASAGCTNIAGVPVEAKVAEQQATVKTLVENSLKNAPAGSDAAVAVIKTAYDASQSAAETLKKVAKQAAEQAEANIKAASAQAEAAVKSAMGKTAKAK